MNQKAFALPLVASLSIIAACTAASSSPSAPPAPAPQEPIDAGGECPAPTAGPTVHRGDVTGDETWTAAASPHIVDADVNVRSGGHLVIEPCAQVQIAAGARINVAFPLTPNTGSLVAEGSAKKPITFKNRDPQPWGSIYVHAPGTARLAYATLEGGGDGAFDDGATIVAPAASFGDPVLFVDHVTIRRSRGTGIWMQRGSTFIAGSQELTITESGSEEHPYPLTISEHAFDALPTGTYTGNEKDELLIEPVGNGGAAGGMMKDATLHDRGVPYHVGRSKQDDLIIGSGPDDSVATLTIEPGVVMKFEPETMLAIQALTTEKPSTGAIRALGTADKPIVFTSAAASPKAGDWRGLWFGGVPQSTNKLEHVRVEYAGFDCHCGLNTCSSIDTFNGAVIFSAQPPSAFITSSAFAHIAGHGITQGFDGTLVDFKPTNTFEDVSGCKQTRPRNADTSCPDPRPACDE